MEEPRGVEFSLDCEDNVSVLAEEETGLVEESKELVTEVVVETINEDPEVLFNEGELLVDDPGKRDSDVTCEDCDDDGGDDEINVLTTFDVITEESGDDIDEIEEEGVPDEELTILLEEWAEGISEAVVEEKVDNPEEPDDGEQDVEEILDEELALSLEEWTARDLEIADEGSEGEADALDSEVEIVDEDFSDLVFVEIEIVEEIQDDPTGVVAIVEDEVLVEVDRVAVKEPDDCN